MQMQMELSRLIVIWKEVGKEKEAGKKGRERLRLDATTGARAAEERRAETETELRSSLPLAHLSKTYKHKRAPSPPSVPSSSHNSF
jgi:hypothetical protein